MLPGLLILLSAAMAQDVAPAAPAPVVTSIGEASAWQEERGTSSTESGLSSLARSADGSVWLLGLEDGSLWRSMDGARTWSRVLRAPSERAEADAEQVLLEGESVVAEDEQKATTQADSSEDADSSGEAVDAATDSTTEGSATTTADSSAPTATPDVSRVAADTLLARAAEDRSAIVWFDPAESSVSLAGRSDGIWRSVDGGLHWSRADDAADAWRFMGVPALGIVVAGSSAGVRVSPDGGGRWFDTVDVTDGLEVGALALLGDQILAGTAGGLFASADGLRWKKLPLSGAVTGILPDPGWPGGVWVTTSSGVLRSDDGAKTFYTAGRQVLTGLRGLAALPGQGHLCAFGTDGVWESMDGGVTWRPVYAGLRDPDVRSMVVVDGTPVIAASRSVWRLGISGELAVLGGRSQRSAVSPEESELLGALIDQSVTRTGLRLDALNPRAIGIRAFLPTIGVEGLGYWAEGRDSTILTAQTVENRDGYFEFRTIACFGGCNAASAIQDLGDAVDNYAGEVDTGGLETIDTQRLATGLYTLNDEILGAGSESLAATNTAQKVRKYRGQVADQVAGAWSTLQRLDHTSPPPSLSGQVSRILDIQEAEARLDLYTDGAYTRARIAEHTP